MHAFDREGMFAPPRLVTAGSYRRVLFGPDDGLQRSLQRAARSLHVDADGGMRGWLQLMRRAPAAIEAGAECLHLLDASLALPGKRLARRYGIRVTATLEPGEAARGRLAGSLDQYFAHAPAGSEPAFAGGRALAVLPPAAAALPAPTERRLAGMARLVRDGTPGRLVVAALWPEDREGAIWLRDAVAPLLHGKPVVLLLGAPRGRSARLLFGAAGHRRMFRRDTGRIDADTLAAAARCADAFVVPAPPRCAESIADVLLAMASSRVPVVAGGAVCSEVLAHERNALLADPGDRMGLVSTLNSLLAMPAIQRHYMGEEFADYTQSRWNWDASMDQYVERFAALVGRPQIPADLRAA